MHTYLLDDDDVRRYVCDFASRLVSLAEDCPLIWITLGLSGDKIAAVLADEMPVELHGQIQIVRTSFDRPEKKIVIRDDFDWLTAAGKVVLLIDSAVHSGASMSITARALFALGVEQLITYSLIVKRTTDLIPNFFGVVIDEHDRAFFQLDRYSNNRLQVKWPFGILRLITDDDLNRPKEALNTGVPPLDKISFADLMYSVRAQNSNVMLYEVAGDIAGFVQFSMKPESVIQIDAIVNDQKYKGTGVGATLMRWVETFARASRCRAMDLWAIEGRANFYQKFGFSLLSDEGWDLVHGEIYFKMRHKLLYNLKVDTLQSR